MKDPAASSYPFVIRNAVSTDFLRYVATIIENQLSQFVANNAGANRKFLHLEDVLPEGDKVLYECKKHLAEHFQLGEYEVLPELKDFLTHITEGGFVHPHTDRDLEGKRHVRINVLIKQTQGCIPLVDGLPLEVEAGDAWLNFASLCEHGTTPVVGPGFRSALSFGFQINPSRCDQLYAIHKDWMRQFGSSQISLKRSGTSNTHDPHAASADPLPSIVTEDRVAARHHMNFAEVLGWAVHLLAHTGKYRDYPLACVELWLVPAARMRQLHLIKELDGRLIGYMTWARFAADTEQRWIHDPEVTLHPSEWNEGGRLWILDFIAAPGYARRCIALVKKHFPECHELRFLRRDTEGCTRRISHWYRDVSQSGRWRRGQHKFGSDDVVNTADSTLHDK